MAERCRFLEWDSEFFGLRIARVEGDRLEPAAAAEVLGWCRDRGIDCLYLQADCGDAATIATAGDAGFRLADVRVVLERPPGPSGREVRVRPWAEEDIPALRDLAGRSHLGTRFYRDGRFPRERCRALYETWIERSCRGWAQMVMVGGAPGKPAGYVTGHLEGGEGRIGLLAVEPREQGNGLSSELMEAALDWFASRGASRVSVATQAANIPALRFYQKIGFLASSVSLWYHLWPRAAELGR